MRIAQVSPYDLSYHGGVVAHTASLSKELSRRGHEVVLFAPCARPQTAPDVSGLEVVPLGGSVPFNASGSVSRISVSIRAARQMRRILTSERFDVVHIHEPLMPFLGATASWFSPWPTVGTFHAYSENIHPGYLSFKPALQQLIADKLDGRIAVSNAAKAYAYKYFPDNYDHHPQRHRRPKVRKPQTKTQRVPRRRHKPRLRRPRWRKTQRSPLPPRRLQQPEMALPQPPPNRRRRRSSGPRILSNDGRTRHRRRHLRRPRYR